MNDEILSVINIQSQKMNFIFYVTFSIFKIKTLSVHFGELNVSRG